MRSFWVKCFVCALGVGAVATIANAQNNRDIVVPDKEAKKAAAESIVAREEAATGRAFDPRFRAEALRKLVSRTPSELESIQSQSNVGLGITPEAFGSSQADLVYTPVTPCRIIDTRVAGGPIGAGAQRNFLATGTNYSGQGGFAGSCGIPFGPTTAIVVNLVAVSPPAIGDLRAFPYGATVPLASVLNYVAGNNIANGIVLTICDPSVASCGFDFTVQSDGSITDLVADIQGYFARLPSTLASGRTMVGTYAIDFVSSAGGQSGVSAITFALPLASAPTPNIILAGGSPTTACPGSSSNPTAAPGYLCVYETQNQNVSNRCVSNVVGTAWTCGVASTFGAVMYIQSTVAGRSFSVGTWALRAP